MLDGVIRQLAKTHFGRFKVLHDLISYVVNIVVREGLTQTLLYFYHRDLIRPDVEKHKSRAFSAMKETLELEASPSYAQNEIDYLDLRDKWLAKYRYARRNPGRAVENDSSVQRALQYLAQAGYTDLDVDDLARLSPRDKQVDDELIVMADVRAYFTIACKVGDIYPVDLMRG